jgi:hypothetical protein
MKQFLKKVVPFSIAFLLGTFVSYVYNSSKILTGVPQNPNFEVRSTLFIPPEPMKCGQEPGDLISQKLREINKWLDDNPNADKKQIEAKSKEINELIKRTEEDRRIEELKKQIERGGDGVSSDLLYKCNESGKWKNLKPGN